MAKAPNVAKSETLRLTLSPQSVQALNALARRGVYGRNPAEVAARLVDRALQDQIGFAPLAVGKDGRIRERRRA